MIKLVRLLLCFLLAVPCFAQGISNPPIGSASANPGGADKSVQINNGGAFGGVAPGSNGNVLKSDGTNWTSGAAPAGNPAGSSGDVQVNNGGAFAGVAPGSSGNVLTSNGSTWSSQAPSGGGSSNFLHAKVPIDNTACLNIVTSRPQVLAAPGAGKGYVIHSVSLYYKHVSTAFNNITTWTLRQVSSGTTLTDSGPSFLGSATTNKQSVLQGYWWNGTNLTNPNDAVYVYFTGTNPSQGDGSLQADIFYSIVDSN